MSVIAVCTIALQPVDERNTPQRNCTAAVSGASAHRAGLGSFLFCEGAQPKQRVLLVAKLALLVKQLVLLVAQLVLLVTQLALFVAQRCKLLSVTRSPAS
jgi:hypothetical protein